LLAKPKPGGFHFLRYGYGLVSGISCAGQWLWFPRRFAGHEKSEFAELASAVLE
jgi:hypothetical protein